MIVVHSRSEEIEAVVRTVADAERVHVCDAKRNAQTGSLRALVARAGDGDVAHTRPGSCRPHATCAASVLVSHFAMHGVSQFKSWKTEIGIFFLLLWSTAYFYHPVEYDNTKSRFLLLSAIVDGGRLNIDSYASQTVDVSVSGGHTYSNKAIGASLVAVPVYWLFRQFSRNNELLSRPARYTSRLVTTSIPYAILGMVMFRMLLGMGAMPLNAFAAVMAYAFGTIAWVNAMLFGGHQMAANFAFFSFAGVWSLSRKASGGHVVAWFGAGLLAGLAALADYTAMYLAAVLAGYAIKKAGNASRILSFLCGGVVTASALAVYNAECFGNPWSLSYAHLGYEEFAAGSQQGVLGISMPDPTVLAALLFSCARGLIFIMPVLCLSLAGFRTWTRGSKLASGIGARPEWSAEGVTVAFIVIGYLLMNAGFYGWHGGWAFGPRYLVPALPFLILPMAFALDWVWYSVLFLISAGQVGCAAMGMPHTPQDFRNPVVECIFPLFSEGYMALNLGSLLGLQGLVSILPWLAVTVAMIWVSRPSNLPDAADVRSRLGTKPPMKSAMRKQKRAGENVNRSRRDPSGSRPRLATAKAWAFAYAVVVAGIVLGLIVVRTPKTVDQHFFRFRLLRDAGSVLSSDSLSQAAVREYQLSRSSGTR